MDSPNCGFCKSETEWLPNFELMETQTVERWNDSGDDRILRDETYPVVYSVSRCLNPECGKLYQYDLFGGLGEISIADYEAALGRKLPKLHEK